MSRKSYMILGGVGGLALVFAGLFLPGGDMAVVTFGAGALFGKGYGIWETRDARARERQTGVPGDERRKNESWQNEGQQCAR
ncbi:hypothetical protein [uncultured Jannaschia sp.]|uniref:hypothetical protein n=1 Tax=uncultured Jannaschia sp. TaxID=293347 RepID=UPI00260200C8|nr:hypothetical protein [uncultured Jannaschia sp.]